MKGTYCLIINVKTDFESKIGSLGKLQFEKGHYVYVGSALNNLEKRIARHLRRTKNKHWHIDYLLTKRNVQVEKVFYKESEEKQECRIAGIISSYGVGVANFGSSDCKCRGHLFRIYGSCKIQWSANGMKSAL